MECIEYLKRPTLVANIQNYFGVKKCDKSDRTSTESTKYTLNNSSTTPKNAQQKDYEIANKFWYYLFVVGTALGDEVFYICFIPFWFWNIDGAVGRRVVLVWTIVMYIGQGVKDIIRWPRPGYPVIRLQNKWALEYGMPSTHAMVAVSIPFSVLLYTMNRYQYNVPLGLAIAIVWCTVVCISRIYLGMHTVLDIIAGLALALILMLPLVPLVDRLDNYLLTSPHSPILLLVTSILMIIYYPNSEKWTPTRGDTTMIVSVCVGVHIGAWLNYQFGAMSPSELSPPYAIFWPSYVKLGCTILRTILGFLCVVVTKVIAKIISYNFLCALLRQDVDNLKRSENSLQNKHKTFVELSCKYFTCALIGFNITYLFPNMFRLLRIERPTFYTEI